ncbi:histidine kinase [Aneurinibacillus migulanus]|uniref:hybrid sensor histidine kinase/response regulator n=1 Tax=Aneurinibacillus migulanus TaxID=47500 RepID=UPI0006B577EB|nr:ATP-binding protein [Aneurinibacillus migulanus]KPD08778.1 histidine kinase [Aneurinibacillus migulanus]
MLWIRNHTILKQIAIIMMFLSILLGLRWFWFTILATPEHPDAARGVLDMRGWNFENSSSIPLNGEWEFYPEAFISHEGTMRSAINQPHYVQVPGDWRRALPKESDSSFGYGTYRLRILVDQPLNQPYTFWIQQIQASSIVEINGETAAVFGLPTKQAQTYRPSAVSYTASYTADNAKEIELLVRVANFDHPLKGGIVKSIRFGSQAAIDNERWYSIGFQLVTFIILLLHGLYAILLYVFGPRQKAFLMLFLLLLSAGLSIVSDHDNLLLLWLPLDYIWALKIKVLSYIGLSFFSLALARSFSEHVAGTRLFYSYIIVLGLYSAFLLIAPAPLIYYSIAAKVFSFLYLFPLAWFVYLIGNMFVRNQPDSIFLLFAATSIVSSVVWGVFNYKIEVTRVYYPIDIIAAIIGFSAYGFKRYFRNSEENAKLNEQLRKADKLKDQFLANTSHELRTPLHAIMNIAQTVAVKEQQAMDGKSFKDMELLITISRRMSHMLDDLLDVVRLQDNLIMLQKEPLLIQSVASGVIGMLQFMTNGKPVQLKIKVAESMPPVLADEKRLVQILFNLLHNALKYTNEGTITVSAELRNGHAVIHVSDTGSGMDEETLTRIFLPYEQGPHGISNGSGIGLGLSICKQLVELHGGELTVHSELCKGSVFSFMLPLATPSDLSPFQNLPSQQSDASEEVAVSLSFSDALTSAWPLQSPLSSFTDGKMNILAVDDDPVNLKVLVSILSTESYNIRSVTSAREALELLGTERWDLLITDVMMPHVSGYELTRRVRERFSLAELPVLLLTARSQPTDIYAGFLSGANDYVTKPVDALELKSRIWSLTTLKQSVHERLRMEAAYLQAQIHPHFLFNTLNSIMALGDIDTEKMRRLGDAFASYLRVSFDFLNSGELVTLSHELELVSAYLYIEKERFEDRLFVTWEVDPNIDLLLPPLTIQPLIENAVKHGILSQVKGGTVQLRITRQDGSTLFEVRDDGKGMEQEKVQQILDLRMRDKSGIGLSNTNRRLTQMYGKGLSIHSKLGEGTVVSFIIPDPNK